MNAKEYHQNSEDHQFEMMKSNITNSDNSPPSIKLKNQPLNSKIETDENRVRKPPISHQKSKSKPPATRIPSISKPKLVPRVEETTAPKEEKKRHKGKTPSFGNTNASLFLNNFQIETKTMR